MSYDRGLAHRIRELLGSRGDFDEREMFGGVAFMTGGHIVVGVVGSELMARVGKAAWLDALGLRGTREMTFTGRSMKTMVFVESTAIEEDVTLASWIDRCLRHAKTLPPK